MNYDDTYWILKNWDGVVVQVSKSKILENENCYRYKVYYTNPSDILTYDIQAELLSSLINIGDWIKSSKQLFNESKLNYYMQLHLTKQI